MYHRQGKVPVWITALIAIAWFTSRSFHAQTSLPQLPPGPPPVRTFRIGVTAVEIDAVVTDRSGRHVPDLQFSDFELLQDGKPQTITSFRYVPIRPAPTGAGVDESASAAPLTSGPYLRRASAGRVMAIVIDDLSVSFADMVRVREALLEFIDRFPILPSTTWRSPASPSPARTERRVRRRDAFHRPRHCVTRSARATSSSIRRPIGHP